MAASLALTGVALDAQALTLGAITVRSSLGQPLRAEIEVPQISSEEAATLSTSLASAEIFDQLGVEFNPALAGAKVTLERRRNGQAYLRVVGNRPVNEPFLGLVVNAKWSGGHVMRDYTMLVDPSHRAAPAPAQVAKAAPGARTTAPRIAPPTRAVTAEQVRPRRARRGGRAAAPADAPAPAAPITGEGGQVTVKRGDTAAGIARRHAAPGVSLDQMLVAMLRANPRAFIKGNVNLIRAGAVLDMPSAEQAAAMPRREARRTVVAQTRDFVAYRRGLASHIAGSAPRVSEASRQAAGNVQPQVSDSKAPAPATDVVEMSRASAPSAAKGEETKISQSRQARESAARADELKRNIEQLNQLQGASTPAPAASSAKPAIEIPASLPGSTAPAAAPSAPAPLVVPPPIVTSAPASATPPAVNLPKPATPASVPLITPIASAPAPAASTPAPAASTPAPAASTPAPAASTPAPAASTPAPAPAASAPAPVASVQLPVPVIDLPSKPASAAAVPMKPAPAKPAPKPTTPAKQPEPKKASGGGTGLLLPAGVGLLALLAGFGLWRSRKKKKDTALSSDFVGSEAGSQAPNSWLGSGDGQALDSKAADSTAGGGGLSMIYSPSQLDAAGDVDPVAEADVYLAYGRDVQAEEILREALITQPSRTAIHRKLAEIYSKRRDARALEDVAQKAHAISGGHGVDWQAIAALGAELDPDNGLYRGEAPSSTQGTSTLDSQSGRPAFGADTVPLSAQSEQPEDSGSVDLDIGDDSLSMEDSAPGLLGAAPPTTIDPVSPEEPSVVAADTEPGGALLDFPLDGEVKLDAPAAAAPAADGGMLDFNMDELSKDQEARSAEGASTEQPADADGNPLATQLELAKEFYSIGDVEGARKLVQEVIKGAEGKDATILARAQRFLDELNQ
ncbi:MAG: hypothetical protein J5820_02665 [Rhodocyclaceae bacterium]|nr:hypothetical protein [Rhodocyclaceae bacterium]